MENSAAQRRACEYLLSKQRADGGWGESYLSSQDKVQLQSMCINYSISFIVPDVRYTRKHRETCLDFGMLVTLGV